MVQQKGVVFAEDRMGHKIDKCITDTGVKFVGGLLIGGVFSLLFFKRRAWPVITGAGFGLGMAYNNCERDLNN